MKTNIGYFALLALSLNLHGCADDKVQYIYKEKIVDHYPEGVLAEAPPAPTEKGGVYFESDQGKKVGYPKLVDETELGWSPTSVSAVKIGGRIRLYYVSQGRLYQAIKGGNGVGFREGDEPKQLIKGYEFFDQIEVRYDENAFKKCVIRFTSLNRSVTGEPMEGTFSSLDPDCQHWEQNYEAVSGNWKTPASLQLDSKDKARTEKAQILGSRYFKIGGVDFVFLHILDQASDSITRTGRLQTDLAYTLDGKNWIRGPRKAFLPVRPEGGYHSGTVMDLWRYSPSFDIYRDHPNFGHAGIEVQSVAIDSGNKMVRIYALGYAYDLSLKGSAYNSSKQMTHLLTYSMDLESFEAFR